MRDHVSVHGHWNLYSTEILTRRSFVKLQYTHAHMHTQEYHMSLFFYLKIESEQEKGGLT